MSDTIDVGDVVRLSVTITDAATGVAVDPTFVALTLRAPDGTTVEPAVVETDPGVFHGDVIVDQAGPWHYRWASTGLGQAAEEGTFYVARTKVPA